MNTYNNIKVKDVLKALHADARNDFLRMGKGIAKSIFGKMEPKHFENVYLPISSSQGAHLKQLITQNHCKHVVEFGTSFGISTIYLADGVRATGGKVITTELIESKAIRASQNISDAGLSAYVDVRIGDALETLKDLDNNIDLLFLDGWKDLYLSLFKLLAPKFRSGTLIYADNMDMPGTKSYAEYVVKNDQFYHTISVDDGKGFLTKVL